MNDETLSFFADIPKVSVDDYNPRWVQYCRVHNIPVDKKPEMVYLYIIWISQKWEKWDSLNGNPRFHTKQDHIDFDKWLESENN